MQSKLIALALLLVASTVPVLAQNAIEKGPTSNDIFLANAEAARAAYNPDFPIEVEVNGDIIRYVSERFPLQEETVPDRSFCEPFQSFGEQHWHCTYMRKARRVALGNGTPEVKINRAKEEIADLPFQESRQDAVLVAKGDGYDFAFDYVRPIDGNGYEVRAGLRHCARVYEKTEQEGLLHSDCAGGEPYRISGPENCVKYTGPGPDPERPWKDLPDLGTNLVAYFFCEAKPALLSDD